MTEKQIEGIEKALALGGGTHTIGDVCRQILAGDAQLWEAEDALIVTEVHDTPRMRVVHFWLATGDVVSLVALSRKILEWAKSVGCRRATLAGRRGWERVLAAEGWEPMLTLMGREV